MAVPTSDSFHTQSSARPANSAPPTLGLSVERSARAAKTHPLTVLVLALIAVGRIVNSVDEFSQFNQVGIDVTVKCYSNYRLCLGPLEFGFGDK